MPSSDANKCAPIHDKLPETSSTPPRALELSSLIASAVTAVLEVQGSGSGSGHVGRDLDVFPHIAAAVAQVDIPALLSAHGKGLVTGHIARDDELSHLVATIVGNINVPDLLTAHGVARQLIVRDLDKTVAGIVRGHDEELTRRGRGYSGGVTFAGVPIHVKYPRDETISGRSVDVL